MILLPFTPLISATDFQIVPKPSGTKELEGT